MVTAVQSTWRLGDDVIEPALKTPLHLFCLSLLATLLAAQETRFTHQHVLAKGMACVSCHSGQAASASLSDKRRGKVLKDFNHRLHLSLGNVAGAIAAAIDQKTYLGSPNRIDLLKLRADLITDDPCQACHRGLAQSTGPPGKAHFPHMEDCLVCHNQIDTPFSCEQCHPAGLKLKPANHGPDFLDRHTSGKLNLDKTTCAACHGKRFTCQGCH